MKKALKKWIQQKPFFRKINFFERVKSLSHVNRQAQAQEMFNLLSRQQFDGWSFINSTLCIAIKPTEEEISQRFEELKDEVYRFFEGLVSFYPNLHAISKEDLDAYHKVIAAKAMVTLYDDLYYVSSVVLLRKNDDGTWQTVKEKKDRFDYFTERKHSITSPQYPESVNLSFCGSFGDVNYVEQADFQHHIDFFYAF